MKMGQLSGKGFKPLRWFNHLYATYKGYFWIACPRCGRMFGGHESTGRMYIVDGSRIKATCSNCPYNYLQHTDGTIERLPPDFYISRDWKIR